MLVIVNIILGGSAKKVWSYFNSNWSSIDNIKQKMGETWISEGTFVCFNHLLTKLSFPTKYQITGMNTLLIMAYKCGVSPETLARWYYGK